MSLKKSIIIIGVGRSGTTIISEILFQHEDLAWPSNYQSYYPDKVWVNRVRLLFDNALWQLKGQKPQLNRIPFYNKIAFKPTEAYPFWEHITHANINFSRDFLTDRVASDEEKKNIRDVFEKMINFQKRKRLAFKITGPGRIGYLQSIFPDAIFIEITREPFSNIRSLLKVPFWKERGMHQLWWQGAYSEEEKEKAIEWKDRPALLTALQYKKIRDKTREEVDKYKVQYHSIPYENFITNPQMIINQIMDITKLKKSKSVNQYLQGIEIYNRNNHAFDFFNDEDRSIMIEMLRNYR